MNERFKPISDAEVDDLQKRYPNGVPGAWILHEEIPALDAAVQKRIVDLQVRGGPSDDDFEEAKAFIEDLCTGDPVLYHVGDPDLADAIAMASFCPGGVTVFGKTWESRPGI